VYDAIRLKQPDAARAAMLDMIADSRANLKGIRAPRKPPR
jgi:DNA-binding FadR family transcriptional regulator